MNFKYGWGTSKPHGSIGGKEKRGLKDLASLETIMGEEMTMNQTDASLQPCKLQHNNMNLTVRQAGAE